MFQPSLPYPVDRLINPEWTNTSSAPQINYQLINVNPNVSNYLPLVAIYLAITISRLARTNPLRVFNFNKMSANNWNNESFITAVAMVTNMIMSNGGNFNDTSLLATISDKVSQHLVVMDYKDYYNIFSTMLDGNTINNLNMYLSNMNAPQQMQPFPGQGMPQPGIMPTFGQQNMLGANTNYVNRKYNDDERYGDTTMDRTQHQMGLPVTPSMGIPPVTSPTRGPEVPKPDIFNSDTDHVSENNHGALTNDHLIVVEMEPMCSFKELGDFVFSKESDFFHTSRANFNYVFIETFQYFTNLSPKTKSTLDLNLKLAFTNFFNEIITTEEMKSILAKLPSRVKRIIDLFKRDLKLRVNNLIATNKCGTRIDVYNEDIINEYHPLIVNLTSKARQDVVDDLKIALNIWVNDLFNVIEYKYDDLDKIMYRVQLNVTTIVVNVNSATFKQYSLDQLDFLCELRTTSLFVITNDNVLYLVDFCSKTINNELHMYVPIGINIVAQLY